MIIHEMTQGSPEWHQVKCGKISSSCMSDVMAKGRGNAESKTRRSYMIRLIAERLSGIPQETYCNGAMQWGIETEPLARQAYEYAELTVVDQVGFVETSEYLGCSPDGFVGDRGLLEIKCPNTTTHVEYLLDNRLPPAYVNQVQSQLWICEREYCDFVSFDPRLICKPYFKTRVERDEEKIKELKIETEIFINELLELEHKIKGELA